MEKNKKNYDLMMKLLILGDSGVGKSSLLLRFSDKDFKFNLMGTTGIDFKSKTIIHDNKTIKLIIWDTAGQEKFQSLAHTYYKGAMGIILVYDISDRASFSNVRGWISQIENNANPYETVLMLIANKSDKEERKISFKEGIEMANKYSIDFAETSAKSNTNVNESFYKIVENIYNNKNILKKCKDNWKVIDKENFNLNEEQNKKNQNSKKCI